MKKLFSLSIFLAAFAAIISSFKPKEIAPKIYPELETYFKTLENPVSSEHQDALANIKNEISTSNLDYDDWNLIFYCSENTFRSQASQVFAQTLCYANKHKKIKVFSAGLKSGEISSKLIDYLSKIGYKITRTQAGGKTEFAVKYSDQAPAIILYSKTTEDKSLPDKDATSIIVCDVKSEADCASLKTETSPLNLAFRKVTDTDENTKIESTLKSIASEMVFVTKK